MKRKELTYIGTVIATHGVKGEIQCNIQNAIFDEIELEYFVIEIDKTYIPFFIEEYRWKSNTTLLIKFADIDDQQEAAQLIQHDIYIPTILCPGKNALDINPNQLNGYIVEDIKSGIIGKITNIDFITPENAILLLDNDLVIPLHPNLVKEIKEKSKTIIMELPDGLIE